MSRGLPHDLPENKIYAVGPQVCDFAGFAFRFKSKNIWPAGLFRQKIIKVSNSLVFNLEFCTGQTDEYTLSHISVFDCLANSADFVLYRHRMQGGIKNGFYTRFC